MTVRAPLSMVAADSALTINPAFDSEEETKPPETSGNPDRPFDENLIFRSLERVVASFNFDEPENPYPVPDRWVRVNEHGFPKWNYALCQFDPPEPAAQGGVDRTYRLQISGGNSGIRLVQGVVAAIPLTDYSIRVMVRTGDLENARARVRACFIDEQGAVVEGSESWSRPVLSNGAWTEIRLTLAGQFEDAAWIQVDLLLIQPEKWQQSERFGQEVRQEDVRGTAWFNDLVITRLPRIDLSASLSNVVVAPDPVELAIRVQDASAGYLTGRLMMLDQAGTLIQETTLTGIQTDKTMTWSPGHVPYGWYRIILEVWESASLAGRSYVDFAYVPEGRPGLQTSANRFGIVADDDGTLSWTESIDLLHELGARSLVVPIYGGDLTLDDVKPHRSKLEPPVDRLLRLGHSLTFSLPGFPTSLMEQLSSKGLATLNLFEVLSGTDQDAWMFLDPLLIGFGQRVPGWVVGTSQDPIAYLQPDVPARLKNLQSRFSEVVPDPRVYIPWPIDYMLPAEQIASADADREMEPDTTAARGPGICRYQMVIPDAFDAASSADLVSTILRREGEAQVLLEGVDAGQFGWNWAASSLTRKACLVWERVHARSDPAVTSASLDTADDGTDADIVLCIRKPWDEIGLQHPQTVPTPAYPVWRNIIQHLSGRRPAGRLDLGEGVTAIIFRGTSADPSQGTICLWNDSDRSETVEARMFLGTGAVSACDLVGNTQLLPFEDGEHVVAVGRTPMFIDGADVQLAMFRAGFRFTPDFVDTGTQVHDHTIRLSNPWETTLSGQLRIDEPDSWKYKQRVLSFSVPAGATADIPVNFATPIFELAGSKEFAVNATLESSRSEGVPTIRLAAPIEVGYRRILLQAAHHYTTTPDGTEFLIVTEDITNDSDEPVWLEAFALAKGYPYQRADVGNLQPGHRATRMFRFQIGTSGSGGSKSGRSTDQTAEPLRQIRVGLRELNGPGRVNQIIEVEPRQ